MTIDRRHLLAATAALSIAGPARATWAAASAMPEGETLMATTPDGLRLAVRAYGDPGRPEILFIHGLGQCRLSWDKQVESHLAAQFRLVIFDLRGHGDSDKPDDALAYAEAQRWADDLAAVIEAAKLRRPVLVGWSLGGLVAGHYLARHGAGRVAGLNLVDAVTKLDPDLLMPDSLDFAPKLGDADLAVRSAAIGDFLAACFAIPPTEAEYRRMLAFNGMVPRLLHANVVKIGNAGLDQAFAAVPRMIVTFGAKDRLTSLNMSRRMLALNLDAAISIFDEAGHSPFWEEPDRFNAELATFAAA